MVGGRVARRYVIVFRGNLVVAQSFTTPDAQPSRYRSLYPIIQLSFIAVSSFMSEGSLLEW